MFKKLVLLVCITIAVPTVMAAETGECIEKSDLYGFTVTYWPDSKLVTLSLGKYGRANFFAHYELVKVSYDAGGHHEFYKVKEDSPFPPFRWWPGEFQMDFFTRIADSTDVKMYSNIQGTIPMECNF